MLAEESATQIDPPPAVMPVGSAPTATTWTTRSSAELIREMVPSRVLATQMSGPAAVIALGPAPTGMVCTTVAVTGSMR